MTAHARSTDPDERAGAGEDAPGGRARPRERAELALAMLTDVIDACRESGCFDVIAVRQQRQRGLLARARARREAARRAGDARRRPERGPHLRAALPRRGASRSSELVILPADVPLVRADDIRAVVDALAGDDAPRAVLVRSRDNGTNALGAAPAGGRRRCASAATAPTPIAPPREAAGIEVVELELRAPRLRRRCAGGPRRDGVDAASARRPPAGSKRARTTRAGQAALMDALEAIRTRRSLRQLADRARPARSPRRSAALACLAPAPHHTRPWRYVIVSTERRASARRGDGRGVARRPRARRASAKR